MTTFTSGAGSDAQRPAPSLPMLTRPPTTRNDVVAALGEFAGTFLFLFFAFAGTQIATTTPATSPPARDGILLPDVNNIVFIALAFGLSLMANVWAFYRVTGGLFNPAVCHCAFLYLCRERHH